MLDMFEKSCVLAKNMTFPSVALRSVKGELLKNWVTIYMLLVWLKYYTF